MTHLFIPGPAGQLENIITPPALPASKPIIGIICHPHPLYGGTMHNKVVTTIARAFYDLGITSLRFNFRGIGASAGSYGAGSGEIEDLLAILAWTRNIYPKHDIWLAGFSFGAYIAASVAAQQPVAQLITIAPAVTHFDFKTIGKVNCPWLLLMGEQDEIVDFKEVVSWVESLPTPIQTIYFPGVGHFFHGHLTQLREQLKTCLFQSCDR